VFEPPGEQFDVGPPHRKQSQFLVVTPGDELAEILLIRQSCVPGVTGQEASPRQIDLGRSILAPQRQRR
jgi:hypothetical protein